jgi:NAD(P)-dependent dehydrogenase (short-subunit alcohol dehydrogenase family)
VNDVRALLEASSLPSAALAGRTSVVTGAGRGINARVAEALALLGAHVVVAEIDEVSGAATVAAIRSELASEACATFVATDLADESTIDALMAQCPTIDIVVNNAAAVALGAVTEVPLEEWDHSYRVNVRAPVSLARRTVPPMVDRGYGVFVCLTSVGGAFMGPYECMKAAGTELAATLAAELEGSGVFAFAVGPGQVLTPGLEGAVRELAPMYGMSQAEFLALNADHMVSVAEAAVGIAATIVLAERFHGAETSSRAGLVAAEIDPLPADSTPPSDGGRAVAPDSETRTEDGSIAVARRVRDSFVEQVEGWRARGLFERKWMDRDFQRHAGTSADEAMRELAGLVGAIEEGAPPDTAVLGRLARYYLRFEKLARDHTRDPVALERALTAITSWRDDLALLERRIERVASP